MNWTIDFVVMLLLTSVSGSLVFLVWYGLVRWMERSGYIKITFFFLSVNLLFWLIPISYGVLWMENGRRWGGVLFVGTPTIAGMCQKLFGLWFIGAGFFFLRFLFKFFELDVLKKEYYPVDEEIYDTFVTVCRNLDLSAEKYDVMFDYKTAAPCIGGVLRRCIVLPCKEYSQQELTVIFSHELLHDKQHSLVLNYLAELCLCIHFFNPIMWLYRSMLRYWTEYVCDYEAIGYSQNLGYYFDTIHNILERKFEQDLWNLSLADNDLADRKEKMRRLYGMKKRKVTIAVVLCVMCVMNMVCIVGATELAGVGYRNAFQATMEDGAVTEQASEHVEYTLEAFESGVEVIWDDDMFTTYGNTQSVDWTIGGNTAYVTKSFSATSSQSISVSAWITPADSVVRVGIIQPDNVYRYVLVDGEGGLYHTFELNQSGTYCVCVQNMGSSSIDVSVTYRVN